MATVLSMNTSEETPKKHDDFRDIFRMHVSIARGMRNRKRLRPWPAMQRPYYYIDANAGVGEYIDSQGKIEKTSGLIAVEVLRRMDPPMSYQAVLIDNDERAAGLLRAHDAIRSTINVQVICDDNRATLAAMTVQPSFGLLFTDRNNLIPDFDLLKDLAARPDFQRIDFLLYLSGSAYKRDRCANDKDHLETLLFDLKPFWVVQKPASKHQKTFLLGSNWDGFKEYARLRFVPVKDDEGREYLDIVNYTRAERLAASQGRLL